MFSSLPHGPDLPLTAAHWLSEKHILFSDKELKHDYVEHQATHHRKGTRGNLCTG
jgi:hypothetical protein